MQLETSCLSENVGVHVCENLGVMARKIVNFERYNGLEINTNCLNLECSLILKITVQRQQSW
jgi:hypothetical protein